MKSSVRSLVLLVVAWGCVVAALGASGKLLHLPRPAVPAAVASLTITFYLAMTRVRWVKDALDAIGLRGLLAVHLVRFLGFYFLWLFAQGRLPEEFAMRAGWGDIVAAAGAAILLLVPRIHERKWLLLLWNTIGLIDLIVAVGTGAWTNALHPGSMREILLFPLVLVPLCFVPLLLASHLVLFRWLLSGRIQDVTTKSEVTVSAKG